MGDIGDVIESWLPLRQMWRLSRAHDDPLARPDQSIGSLEARVHKHLVRLLNSNDDDAERLFALARSVRDQHVGTRIDLRAAIDVGNVCRVNCHYCPMRRDNLHGIGKNGRSTIAAYRADSDKIIEVAECAYRLGFRELFLQSGEDTRLVGEVQKAVKAVVDAHPDYNITLNLGALTDAEYQRLWQAGARNYLIKHETANPVLHEQQREETLRHRVDHMLKARQAGFELGSGNILGLPKQTDDDLADDILFLGRFNIVKMVSCAPFTPSNELPQDAREAPPGDFGKTRRFIALLRLCFPEARIPAVSNADSPSMQRTPQAKSGQALLMDAGANGITVNFTPPEWEAHYGLYVRGTAKTYLVSLKKAQQVASETGLSMGIAPSYSATIYGNPAPSYGYGGGPRR
jgi:biotin synthase